MKMCRAIARVFFLTVAFLGAASCATRPDRDLARIEHIVVIYAENRSFDHLYGLFPGAEGIEHASVEQKTQLDRNGERLPRLPPVWRRGKPDPAFPTDLPNGPVRLDAPPINLPPSALTRDLVHLCHVHREHIN